MNCVPSTLGGGRCQVVRSLCKKRREVEEAFEISEEVMEGGPPTEARIMAARNNRPDSNYRGWRRGVGRVRARPPIVHQVGIETERNATEVEGLPEDFCVHIHYPPHVLHAGAHEVFPCTQRDVNCSASGSCHTSQASHTHRTLGARIQTKRLPSHGQTGSASPFRSRSSRPSLPSRCAAISRVRG